MHEKSNLKTHYYGVLPHVCTTDFFSKKMRIVKMLFRTAVNLCLVERLFHRRKHKIEIVILRFHRKDFPGVGFFPFGRGKSADL